VQHGADEGGVRVEPLASLAAADRLLERAVPPAAGGGNVLAEQLAEVRFHRGVANHDEAPVLEAAAARGADRGVEDARDQLVGHLARGHAPHRASRVERLEQLHRVTSPAAPLGRVAVDSPSFRAHPPARYCPATAALSSGLVTS